MWSSRDAFENDFCPVKDDLLGAMYRANEHGLPQLIASIAPDVRAMLALFCYRRSHLHALALSVASNCTERDLIRPGGRGGSPPFARARSRSSLGSTARAVRGSNGARLTRDASKALHAALAPG